MEDKYKKLIDRIKDGDVQVDDLIPSDPNYMEKAFASRDLSQGALGSEYLKQTGVSVPDIKTANRSTIESFLNKLKEEAYPELKKTSVELRDNLPDSLGEYYPDKNKIALSKTNLQDVNEMVGTNFHELGHAFDKKSGTLNSTPVDLWTPEKKKLLKSLGLKSGNDLTKLDASDISEIVQLGHHTNIPKLREGSYGMGALKSLVKNKTFKSLPYIGPAIAGLGTLAATGDVSAATQAVTPILNEAEGIGPEEGSLESMVEDPTKSYEQRRKAIETLTNRNH